MRALALVLLALGGLQLPLDPRAIDDALRIANSSLETTHVRFHADYRVPVNTPPVDFISIVTPFRRVTLAAETAVRQGRRMLGQREALAALQPDPDRVEVFVELTFHPHNTFVAVPGYSIELQPASFRGASIPVDSIDRLPRFGPRLEDRWYPFPYPYTVGAPVPTGSQPLLGGTLIGRLSGGQLDPNGIHAVVVKDGTKELARARVDFAKLR